MLIGTSSQLTTGDNRENFASVYQLDFPVSTRRVAPWQCGRLSYHYGYIQVIPWRKEWLPVPVFLGLPWWLRGKESACNMGDLGSIPGLGRSPGEGNGNPLQYSCREFHGQRSLEGYSPWGDKESKRTEQLTLSLFSFVFLSPSKANKQLQILFHESVYWVMQPPQGPLAIC